MLSCFPPVRIEETWRLWQKFLDDYSRFEDWLKSAERTAACPNSSEVLYTVAKEELKRLEVKALPSPVAPGTEDAAGSGRASMTSHKWQASPPLAAAAQSPARHQLPQRLCGALLTYANRRP